jgi:hypothetical protein
MKVAALAVVFVLGVALAGCSSVGPGGQMQRDATGNAIWSLIIPGVGQFMNGEAGKGALMMSVNVANNLYLRSSEDIDEYNERLTTCLPVGIAVSVWSCADAYASANRLNQGPRRTYHSRAPAETEATPITVCLDPFSRQVVASFCCRF